MRLFKGLRKILSVIATSALLFNSIAPYSIAIAQEITPSPTPTDVASPTPTDTPTISPTDSPTQAPTPTDIASPVASAEAGTPAPTDLVTPIPSDTPIATQAPESNPTVQGPPSDQSTINNQQSTITPSATPVSTPKTPVEHGTLTETTITNIDLSGITGLNSNVVGSGSISTNQADYSPTSLVLISGSGFTANKTYTIEIVSTDQPPVDFTDSVKADSSGNLSYTYQLDGNYRPNYTVYIKSGEVVVATVTFTDSQTINSATLNGGSTVSVLPGTSITANVVGSLTGSDVWHGTQWLISTTPPGSTSCADTTDYASGSNLNSGNFNLTAPVTPGIYNVYFQMSDRSSCGHTVGSTFTMAGAVTVTGPTWPTNWTTPASCLADPVGDQAPSEIDLIGTSVSNPAVGFSSDSNYLYFREQLNNDVSSGSGYKQQAWVVLFQTATGPYQYMATLDGKDDTVNFYQNTSPSGSVDFNPLLNDPAETLLWSGSASAYARAVNTGGHFADWAIPVSQLTGTGITINTTKFFATSSDANNFNKDHLDCYNTGSITVVKSAHPQSSQTFNFTTTGSGLSSFTLDDNGNNSDTYSNTKAFTGLLVGSYSVTETATTGWANSALSCIDNDTQQSVGSITSSTASLTLNPSQNITCTYQNTQQTGTLTVQKTTIPALDPTVFSINATGSGTITGGGAGTVSTSTSKVYTVAAGTYSVSETVPTGWSQTGNTCSGVVVAVGGSASCLITNTKLATVTVVKNTTGGNGTFGFTTTGGLSAPFNVITSAETGTTTFNNVTPGTFSLSETGQTGWTLSSSNCTGTNNTPASFTVAAGGSITCTFNNTKLSNLTIVKNTVGGDGIFNFTATGSGISNFGLTTTSGTASKAFTNINSGSYTVSETVPTGWTLTSSTCDNGNNPSAITLATGATVTCTFTNTKIPQLTVNKILVPSNDPGHFNLLINGTTYATNVINGGSTAAQYANIGSNTIGETAGTGTNLANYTATYGGDCTSSSISLAAGDSKVCTITNTRNTADLKVVKTVDDGTALTNWSFSLDGGAPVTADATGLVDFGQVTTNFTHTITESGVHKSDYNLGNVTGTNCTNNFDGSSGTANIPNGQSTTTCTFVNTVLRGTVNVTKYNDLNADGVDQSEPGLLGFMLSLTGQTARPTDSNGNATFGNLLPGDYTLSENTQGWIQSKISCDNGTYSSQNQNFSLHVNAGQTVTCTIGNYLNSHITVTKDVLDPQGNPITDKSTDFVFGMTEQDPFTLYDGGSKGFDVKPGSYHVGETSNGNYDFKGCTNLNPDGNLTVTSNQSITVACTNWQKTAKITVVKQVVLSDGKTPVLDGHVFGAQLNGANDQPFSETNNAVFTVNPGGPYTIGEASDQNYTLIGCTLPTGAPATEMSLASNDSVTVTCVNKQNPGTISGFKFQSNGTTGINNWTVNLFKCLTAYGTCSQVATTTTDSTGFYSFTNLITGFYQVVEAALSTYTPVGDTFHNVTINPGTLSTGNNYANFKNINITVCKKSDVDGNLETTNDQASVVGWGMTLNSDGKPVGDPQNTGDNGCTTFTNLAPGHDYSVTEATESGWRNITNLTNDFGQPQDGVNQTYTFYNQRLGKIIVAKVTNPAKDEQSFDFTLTGGPSSLDQSFSLTGGTSTDSGYIIPGSGYIASETVPTGWDQTSAVCSNESPVTNISVSAGQTVTCTFTNTKHAHIIVNKITNPEGDQTSFDVNTSTDNGSVIGDTTDGTISSGNPDNFEVTTGTYNISETVPSGWDQTGATCSNEDKPNDVSVNPGQTVTCTFTNTKRGTVTVTKYNDANENGTFDTKTESTLPGWKIVLGDSTQTTLEDGTTTFSNIIPGSYDLNEVLQDGWIQTNIQCFYSNETPGIFNNDNRYIVTVGAGDNITCNIGNFSPNKSITIVKSNDSANTSAGSTVTYTLVIKNTGNVTLNNVSAKDVLPGGFGYVLGTTTGATTADPTVAGSKLTWSGLGTLAPGASFTISYKALIADGLVDGTYTNYATCTSQTAGLTILDRLVREGGDAVNCDPASSNVNLGSGQSYGGNLQGQVLGASTELPGTGSPTALLLAALGLIGIGFIIKRKYAKN